MENNINYLKEYSIGRKVIYLPEEDTIFIDSNDIELIGDKKYLLFENGNMQVITVTENNRQYYQNKKLINKEER